MFERKLAVSFRSGKGGVRRDGRGEISDAMKPSGGAAGNPKISVNLDRLTGRTFRDN